MVDEKEKPAPGDGPESEPKNNSASWFERDFWRNVASAVVATVLATVIITLGGFLSEWSTPSVQFWPALVGTLKSIPGVLVGWQVLLAGAFIGGGLFSAVSINAKHARDRANRNAEYAREQIDRNAQHVLDRDKGILDRQRKSLAAALQVEITHLGTVCKHRAKLITSVLSDERKKTVDISARRWDDIKVGGMTIYQANGAHIGLLSPKAARHVVRFYTLVANYNLAVSGGVIGKARQAEMEHGIEYSEEADDALQEVIDDDPDS